jgi:hypothetical protein
LKIGFLRIDLDDDDDSGTARMVDEVPPDAAMIVCVALTAPLILADNHVGRCAGCDMPLQFRPNIPERVAKVCLGCAPDWVDGIRKAS